MNTLKKVLVFGLFQRARIWKYRFLSSCKRIEGKPLITQAVQFVGAGRIVFQGRVHLGVYPSPFFFNGYIYLEARKKNSMIDIKDGVWINNSAVIISEGPGITIGKNTLIGPNVEIYDSDFHGIEPNKRMAPGGALRAAVHIGENVFIGSNARILKGVTVGDNCVIGTGSIVTRSIPANVVAAGSPAKVIRHL